MDENAMFGIGIGIGTNLSFVPFRSFPFLSGIQTSDSGLARKRVG